VVIRTYKNTSTLRLNFVIAKRVALKRSYSMKNHTIGLVFENWDQQQLIKSLTA